MFSAALGGALCAAAATNAHLRHPAATTAARASMLTASDRRPNLRTRRAASCAQSSHGAYAFDSNTEFMTNFTTTEVFGEGNLAAASASDTLEGDQNTVCDEDSLIGAGYANVIDSGEDNDAARSFMGAGESNAISAGHAFIGAGYVNQVVAYSGFVGAGAFNGVSGQGSFVGAGGTIDSNGNTVSGSDSFIGAGDVNSIAAPEAFIGSGATNSIGKTASYASILGGNRNTATGEYASIIGGFGNSAAGSYAIVAGGDGNSAAGTLSYAAGYHASATHAGSFVWSDYTSGSATLKDTAVNQFVVRASGGTFVYSNEAESAGVELGAGSGTWASLSDRNAKTDLAPLDDASVLAKVDALPVGTWRYASERGVRHAGPMAQDFYRAFGVGEDDRHITSIDEDGVALAAIKALSHEVAGLRGEVGTLHGEVGELRRENTVFKSHAGGRF